MGETTGIAWTDHTFNPWHGCVKVSAGCDRCYAETLSRRLGFSETGSKPGIWGKDAPRRFMSDKHWGEPFKWNEAARVAGRQALVFCGSMCDVFEPRQDLGAQRDRLWWTIDRTRHLIWQLLTKRPEQVMARSPRRWKDPLAEGWPDNVWVGTSVEDQATADLRIPRLLKVPAPVRFLSCEPLLGPVDLAPWIERTTIRNFGGKAVDTIYTTGLGWVIVGGESGPGYRPMDPAAVDELRRLADLASVPFFFKQAGGLRGGSHLLDGETVQAFPTRAGERGQAVAVRRG